jgi:hypothetical protein
VRCFILALFTDIKLASELLKNATNINPNPTIRKFTNSPPGSKLVEEPVAIYGINILITLI